MYETKHQPLIPHHRFIKRLLLHILFGIALIVVSLFIGMWGYHHYEGMSWIDAFVNAAMILSGMGPMTPLSTTDGKLFAGFYALFSGIIFLVIMGVIFIPVFHRFFHQLHLVEK